MGKFRLIIIGILFITSLSGQTGTIETLSFQVQGQSRGCKMYIPAAYDGQESWPLIIFYHGFDMSAQDMIDLSDMDSCADTASFLVAYPEGLQVYNINWERTAPGFNVPGGYTAAHDDIAFSDSLISHIISNYNVDTSRVMATGISNGSTMAFYAALALPDQITAVAGIVGPVTYVVMDSLIPMGTQPSLAILGDADPFFLWEGVPGYLPGLATASFWAQHSGCLDSLVIDLPDVNSTDNSTTTLIKYLGCNENSPVYAIRINNGGHWWPGVPLPDWAGYLGTDNQDINASEIIWHLLRDDSLDIGDIMTTDNQVGIPGDFSLAQNYPNPFNPITTIQYELPERSDVQITIYDLLGKTVTTLVSETQDAGFKSVQWDATHQSSGVYLYQIRAGGYVQTRKMVVLK